MRAHLGLDAGLLALVLRRALLRLLLRHGCLPGM
jgi:hypothetical protein